VSFKDCNLVEIAERRKRVAHFYFCSSPVKVSQGIFFVKFNGLIEIPHGIIKLFQFVFKQSPLDISIGH